MLAISFDAEAPHVAQCQHFGLAKRPSSLRAADYFRATRGSAYFGRHGRADDVMGALDARAHEFLENFPLYRDIPAGHATFIMPLHDQRHFPAAFPTATTPFPRVKEYIARLDVPCS